jgi:hypothetical protein
MLDGMLALAGRENASLEARAFGYRLATVLDKLETILDSHLKKA